jgi:hypothetical protein
MTIGTLLTLLIVGVAASIGGNLGRKHLLDQGRPRRGDQVHPPTSRPPRPIDWTGGADAGGGDGG